MNKALIAVCALLTLSGCAAYPPAPVDQQATARLPDAFKEGAPGAYIIVYKGQIGALVENRVRVDEGAYVPLGSDSSVIWKVSPGVHSVEFDFWAGHDMTKVRLADGDRALLEVLGGLVGRSMMVHGEKASALKLDAFIDASRGTPP